MDVNEKLVAINVDIDIVTARQEGRLLAGQLGFSSSEQVLKPIEEGNREGILIIAQDDGPGIANLEQAMIDGFSSSGGLGLGLSGMKRLMSELDISSEPGKGTTLTMKRWKL
jgi:serine/threonine-protein kinase RsbT